ncbi:MAG: protein kinase [Myxococcota bacterium]
MCRVAKARAEADTGVSGSDARTLMGDDAVSSQVDTPSPGSTLGRYHLLSRLGAGGAGLVFAAYDPELDRKVALKILRPDRASTAVARKRLVREARAMARVRHPNVITVFDAGADGGDVFVAMEFVRGATLRRWLRAERPSATQILAAFSAAGHGLVAAHDQGLIHRDFKPDNVMVGDDGGVHVMDFGLVHRAGEVDALEAEPEGEAGWQERLTRPGIMLGTPMYMAPEQHRRTEPGPWTDQFSFCVALYEALWDRLPYPTDSMARYAVAVVRGEVRKPPPSDVSPRVVEAILRGLSPERADRWPSMSALLEALQPEEPHRGRSTKVVAGVAVAGVVALAAVAQRSDESAPQCNDGAARMQEVWNEERRLAANAAIEALPLGDTSPLAPTIVGRVGEFSDAWVQAYDQACAATRVLGVASEETLHLRRACLAHQLNELDAVVTVLAERTIGPRDLTALAEATLVEFDPCTNPRGGSGMLPVEADPATRERVESVRRHLMHTRALQLASQYTDAKAEYAKVADDLTALDRPRLFALAALVDGSLRAALGELDEGAARIEDAAWLALRIGDAETALRASTELIQVIGHDKLDRLGGRAWIDRALALAPSDGAARARVHLQAGRFLFRIGDSKGARQHYNAAAASNPEGPGADVLRGRTLFGIGRLHLDDGELDLARASFQRSLAQFERIYGQLHPETARNHSALGSVARRQRRLEDAIAHHREAVRINELNDSLPASLAGTLSNLANALIDAGKTGEAQVQLERAVGLLRPGRDDATLLYVLDNLARCHAVAGDRDTAARTYARAIAGGVRSLGPAHPEVNSVRLQMGRNDLDRGRYPEAVLTLRAAYENLGPAPDRTAERARVSMALARALRGSDAVANAAEIAVHVEHVRRAATSLPADDPLRARLAQWDEGT